MRAKYHPECRSEFCPIRVEIAAGVTIRDNSPVAATPFLHQIQLAEHSNYEQIGTFQVSLFDIG